jgi:hypothetical protein
VSEKILNIQKQEKSQVSALASEVYKARLLMGTQSRPRCEPPLCARSGLSHRKIVERPPPVSIIAANKRDPVRFRQLTRTTSRFGVSEFKLWRGAIHRKVPRTDLDWARYRHSDAAHATGFYGTNVIELCPPRGGYNPVGLRKLPDDAGKKIASAARQCQH